LAGHSGGASLREGELDKIDVDQVTEVRLSSDGTRVTLTLLDQAGNKVLLSLPTGCLNSLVTAVPRQVDPGSVHRLDSWAMETTDDGGDLLLTLRTPDGVAISFAVKPWQVEGMATIATYSGLPRPVRKMVH
jgi:hypothetical protein